MGQGFTGAPATAANNDIEGFNVAFTRDMALASGTQAVTGVGFEPRFIIMLMTISGAVAGIASWGFSSGLGEDTATWDNHNSTADSYGTGTVFVKGQTSGGVHYAGSLLSFDSDGFTITWTRTGAPTGVLQMMAQCVR